MAPTAMPRSIALASAAAAAALLTAAAAFVPFQATPPMAPEQLQVSSNNAERPPWQPATSMSGAASAGFALAAAGALALAAASSASLRRAPAAASASRGRSRAVALGAYDTELGATLPMRYFDPLGLAELGDDADFRRRRESEIKNGRVAMWAVMGFIVPEYFRWPGYLSPSQGIKFADIPNGVAALSKVPADGWAQIGAFIAFLELFPFRQDPDRAPGDFKGAGKLGVPWFFVAGRDGSVCDPVANERSLNAELNNGRLAMVAITGMIVQNGFFGTTGPSMWLPGAAFESELGVQAPVGFWDPLGLSKDGDVDTFKRRRAVELKHGRICMLATIGYIIPEYVKFPGYLSPSADVKFADVPHGIAAVSKVPIEGWLQIALFLGHYEGQFFRQDTKRAPGDFEGYGFLGVGKNFIFNFDPPTIADAETKKKKLSAELANGRLAMVAIMAMLFQNGTVGTAGPSMWLPGAAFESELGVQAPVGFWDPLGLSKDGDVDTFKRRRAVELKHGRICMLATIGYIIPEYVKFPGYLSPSADVKFADVPHGIAAVSKVPIEGWLQIALFLGHYEGQFFRQDAKRAPGDFEGYGFLGVGKNFIFNFDPPTIADAETKKKKLSAELANGRLAMVAIMAMLFQNGTVGTAGPSMWLPGSA